MDTKVKVNNDTLKITPEPSSSSNLEMLQSRIDQQVQLICILKQRADEYLQKYMTTQGRLETLEKDKDRLKKSYDQEHTQCMLLRTNIKKLEEFNESITLEKLRMKEENTKFETKCFQFELNVKKLSGEIHALQNKREVQATPDDTKEKYTQLKFEFQMKEEELNNLRAEKRNESMKYETESQQLKNDLAIAKEKLQQTSESLKQLEKNLITKLNEGGDMEKRIASLQTEVASSNDQLILLRAKLNKEREQHSAEKEKMKREFSQIEKTLPAYVLNEERQLMKKNLDAYKQHADQLLSKEKDINAKLLKLKSTGRKTKPSVEGSQTSLNRLKK